MNLKSKNFPRFLEYFLLDILQNPDFCAKKMFGWYWIYCNSKIFAIYVDDEIFLRKNIFIKNEEQFYYFRKWKKVFLPYFKIDESILEDREKIFEYIKNSLDY